ncbi:MAG TPA: hypothetical protein VMT46_17505 [Anaerolineaceae bacterium]|nr:hypothetical protein [Anaerolineaceae bacterium]
MVFAKLKIFLGLILLVFIAACSSLGTPQAVQGQVEPTVQPGETVFPTLPVTQSAPTDTPVPTQAASLPNPLCVTSQSHPDFQRGDFGQYPQAILRFLNGGATVEELSKSLYDAGVASQPRTAMADDMTGDGQQDVVVSIFNPNSRRIPPSGTLLIYVCESSGYRQAFQLATTEDQGAPGIRFLQDLNADGKADLVTSQGSCGASTCFEAVQILTWNGSEFDNALEGSSADLADPDIQIKDPGSSGVYQLVITAGGAGSLGAGPQRIVTRTWIYDPASQHWKPGSDQVASSTYRIHVLQDADVAFKKGDYALAEALYRQVRDDQPALADWMDPVSEKANLGAYAAFKIIVIETVQKKSTQAQKDLASITGNVEARSPQQAYVEMAREFVSAYAVDPSTACAIIKRYAASHAGQVLDPLGSKVFGNSNRDIQPEDLCP